MWRGRPHGNQARVHLWYAEKFGVPATPFRRATDGIDAFVATTCQVGSGRGHLGR